jgi:hypothetical protein
MRLEFIFLAATFSTIYGCGESKDETSSSRIKIADSSGVVTTSIKDSAKPQTILASESSRIRTASVSVPAGSLSIDSTVEIQEGASLGGIVDELDSNTEGSIVAGPSVFVKINENPLGPLQVRIPFDADSADAQSAQLAGLKVAILYLKTNLEGAKELGLAAGPDVVIDEGFVTFETEKYGIFQPIHVSPSLQSLTQTTDTPVVPYQVPSGRFSGLWRHPCKVDASDTSNILSYRSFLRTGPEKYKATLNYYLGQHCESENFALEINLVATHLIGNELPNRRGVRNVNFTFKKHTITPKIQAFADKYNSISLCDMSGYEVNKLVDLSSSTPAANCEVWPKGSTLHGVLKFDGSNLFLMDTDKSDKIGATESDRVTELSEIPYIQVYTRKN